MRWRGAVTVWALLVVLHCGACRPAEKGSLRPGTALRLKQRGVEFPVVATQSAPQGKRPSDKETWSAIALVAGTTVGAGILALPKTTAAPGFVPSSLALVGVWIFMASSGLLIAETSSSLVKQDPRNKDLGYLGMTDKVLGRFGAVPAGTLYVFIHYALLVAYIAGAGSIVSEALGLPTVAGPVLFSTVVGAVLAFGSDEQVATFNSAWVAVVAASFLGLLALAVPSVRLENLSHADWGRVLPALPIMLVALVYHNIVPTVSSQLRYDREAVSKAVVVGSGLPLLMFLLWNAVILGMTSPGSEDVDPLAGLREGAGGPMVGILVGIFSEAAIITSFTGFVIGLLSFFEDAVGRRGEAENKGNGNNKVSGRSSLGLYAAVIVPPAAVALLNPKIFDQALEVAGTYGISLLFGVLPVVLSTLQLRSSPGSEIYLPGGLASRGVLLALVMGLVGGKALALF